MINLSAEPKSIQSLYRDFADGKFVVNRRYQRKLVWTLEEKEKLIESILNKFPIPNILLAKTTDDEEFEIIDGMQRLHTIVSFIEQGFSYKDRYFNLKNLSNAKNRADNGFFDEKKNIEYLTDEECSIITDYILSVLIMRDVDENIVNDVFSRINTYGHRLSDQERRQAGIQTMFSELIRKLGEDLRGDNSPDRIPLNQMPEISIELPRNKIGYGISASNTFWVEHGILRATDLRDSQDEQCIADIIASILKNRALSRGKEYLDKIYSSSDREATDINNKLRCYGFDKIYSEFHFCLNKIKELCGGKKLQKIISPDGGNNPIPAKFSNIFIAIFQLLFNEGLDISESDYNSLCEKLETLSSRLIDGRTSEKREDNINVIKELIRPFFKGEMDLDEVYQSVDTIMVDKHIARSAEQSTLEFKQGCLSLDPVNRKIDNKFFEKIVNTICAIANTAQEGFIIIGVADTVDDVERIKKLDYVVPEQSYRRTIVGVDREARYLEMTIEEYLNLWKSEIDKSKLTDVLKQNVLSHLKYLPYRGLGLILIKIPKQSKASFVGDKMFWRKFDSTTRINNEKPSTEEVTAKDAQGIFQLFNDK